MRLLIAGPRDWQNDAAVVTVLSGYHVQQAGRLWTLVHGACPTGVDMIADTWAELLAQVDPKAPLVEAHPADWSHGREGGPRRNAQMVAKGADLCIVFRHVDLRWSAGTGDLRFRALAARIPTWEVVA